MVEAHNPTVISRKWPRTNWVQVSNLTPPAERSNFPDWFHKKCNRISTSGPIWTRSSLGLGNKQAGLSESNTRSPGCARTRARHPLFVKSVRDIGLLSLRGQIVHLDSIASRPFSGGESGIMGLNHKSKVGVYNIRKNLSQNLDHYPKI